MLEIGAIQLNMLLSLLEDVYVPLGRVDRRVWEGTVDGSFTVKTFFYLLDGVSISLSPFADIWKLKAPPRVVAFAWLALSGCILTKDNLCKRNIILVKGCPMCLKEAE